MASSRLEKIGTIYTRVTGLLRSGALKEVDTPIWYNVYKAFPPQYEPKYDRPAPNISVKNIFYPEDQARAWFQKHSKRVGSVTLTESQTQTTTQKFISLYNKLKEEHGGNVADSQHLESALEMLNIEGLEYTERQRLSRIETKDSTANGSLASTFQDAQKDRVNIKDIFKD